jgi:hypothetical protein
VKYIVELEEGVWIAPWTGDPGRTRVKENARVYSRWQDAKAGLTWAEKSRPFPNAVLHQVKLDPVVSMPMKAIESIEPIRMKTTCTVNDIAKYTGQNNGKYRIELVGENCGGMSMVISNESNVEFPAFDPPKGLSCIPRYGVIKEIESDETVDVVDLDLNGVEFFDGESVAIKWKE